MDVEHIQIERRINQRVFNYWAQLCVNRPMPQESEIDPEALGEDWRHCFLLQVRDVENIDAFNFSYLGEGIIEAYASAGIERDNLHMIGPNAFYLAHQFRRIIAEKAPLLDDGHFSARDGHRIRYRQCLLPLGVGKQVEGIFGAILFTPDVKEGHSNTIGSKSIW